MWQSQGKADQSLDRPQAICDRMRRLHLFEFGDQPWFPEVLRDTESLWAEKSSHWKRLAQLLFKVNAGVLRSQATHLTLHTRRNFADDLYVG
jgi:hypothetical protein